MLFAVCRPAEAQRPRKVYRIGLSDPRGSGLGINMRHFNKNAGVRLRRREELIIERRFAEGKLDRLPALVAELVRLKADIIVVSGAQGALAAKTVTKTIPIVFAIADDPVHSGLVVSLASPTEMRRE